MRLTTTLTSGIVLLALCAAGWWVWNDRLQYRSMKHAKDLLWEKVYAGGGETLYCGAPFLKKSDLEGANSVEHVVPLSDLKKLCPLSLWNCGRYHRAASDLHNLWTEFNYVNQVRDNHPFGEIPGDAHRQVLTKCPDFELVRTPNGRIVEPRDEAKGEIARTILYMQQKYGMQFHADQNMLQRWNASDPPSDFERQRNDLIFKLQDTRNPIIDAAGRAPSMAP